MCVWGAWINSIEIKLFAVFSIFERLDELEYTRVTLTGHFDHSRELHMWPRTLNSASDKKQQNTEPGACIVTPFYCRELGEWVLVNRGWVPRRKMDPSTRSKGQVRRLIDNTFFSSTLHAFSLD